MEYEYSFQEVYDVWLAENINRKIPNNFGIRTVERPNNSINMLKWLISSIGQIPDVQTEILNLINMTGNDNIYITDGVLTGDRILTGNGQDLTYSMGTGTVTNEIEWKPFLNRSRMENSGFAGTSTAFVQTTTGVRHEFRDNANIVESTVDNTNKAYMRVSDNSGTTYSDWIALGFDGIEMQFDTTSDLKINGVAGLPNQILISQGPNLPPVWADVTALTPSDVNIYNSDGTLTGNRILTANGNTLTYNFNTATNNFSEVWTPIAGRKLIESEAVGGTTSTKFLINTTNTELINVNPDGSEYGLNTGEFNTTLKAKNTTTLENSELILNDDGIDLRFSGTDLRLNNNPGTAGQVLTSNGVNNSPTWETIATGTGADGAITNVVLSGNDIVFTGSGTAFTGTVSLPATVAPSYISNMVYVPSTQVLEVTGVGSAFNGNLTLSDLENNIYVIDGSLTNNRQVDLDGNSLTFINDTDNSVVLDTGSIVSSFGPTTGVNTFAGTTVAGNRFATSLGGATSSSNSLTTNSMKATVESVNTATTVNSVAALESLITPTGTALNLKFESVSDLRLNNDSGTIGQVLTSNGIGVAPTWETLSAGSDGVITNVTLSGSDLIFTGVNGGFNGTVTLPASATDNYVSNVTYIPATETLAFTGVGSGFNGNIVLNGVNDNLYTVDGTLANNRIVDFGGNTLTFQQDADTRVLMTPTLFSRTNGSTTGTNTSVFSSETTNGMTTNLGGVGSSSTSVQTNATGSLIRASNTTTGTSGNVTVNPLITGTGTSLELTFVNNADLTLNGSVGTSGQVLTSQGAGNAPIWTTVGSAGATTFLALTDTPAAYGTPGQVPVINAAGTALEFASFDNIYNVDGTLTGNRTVTGAGNFLDFAMDDGTDISTTRIWDRGIFSSSSSTVTNNQSTFSTTPTVGGLSSNGDVGNRGYVYDTVKVQLYYQNVNTDEGARVWIDVNGFDFIHHGNGAFRLDGVTGTAGQVITADANGKAIWANAAGGSPENIYTDDGTLLADRTLTGNGNDLTFDMSSAGVTFTKELTASSTDNTEITSGAGLTQRFHSATTIFDQVQAGTVTNSMQINNIFSGLRASNSLTGDNSDIFVRADGIYLELNGSPLYLDSNSGSAGDVITNVGGTPEWASPSAATLDFVQASTAPYTMAATDDVIEITNAGLPVTTPVSPITGKIYYVRNSATGANNIIANGTTINGAASFSIAANSSERFFFTGTQFITV